MKFEISILIAALAIGAVAFPTSKDGEIRRSADVEGTRDLSNTLAPETRSVELEKFTKRDEVDGTIDGLSNTETVTDDANDLLPRDPKKGKGKKGKAKKAKGKKKNAARDAEEDESVSDLSAEDGTAEDTSADLIVRDPKKGKKGKKGGKAKGKKKNAARDIEEETSTSDPSTEDASDALVARDPKKGKGKKGKGKKGKGKKKGGKAKAATAA